jgi:type IV pilus assembly protein PilM
VKKNQNVYATSLSQLLTAARTTTNLCVSSLSTLSTFTTLIEMPVMPRKELDLAVRWEAKKLVPLPLDKLSLDWHVLPLTKTVTTDKKAMTKVILTAASKDDIDNSVEILRQANLKLMGMDTELSALRRALLANSQEAVLIIDIGATSTCAAIFLNSIPIISHSINMGGETIDVNIANGLKVSLERAAQFKINFGPALDSGFEHPVSKVIKFAIDNLLVKELKSLINSFQSNNKTTLGRIIITGGGAHFKDLTRYLQKVFSVEATIGDPWANISYPQDLASKLQKIGPEMAVAIGLALRGA